MVEQLLLLLEPPIPGSVTTMEEQPGVDICQRVAEKIFDALIAALKDGLEQVGLL